MILVVRKPTADVMDYFTHAHRHTHEENSEWSYHSYLHGSAQSDQKYH